MFNSKKSKAGFTIIEVILSITIIGLIVIAFMPLFTMSATTNSRSKAILDSTYLGKDAMELIYDLSKTIPYKDLREELENEGYIYDQVNNIFSREYSNKEYLTIKLDEEGDLIRVIVKAYGDKSMEKLEAQYESLYSWIGRGILNGKE